MLRENEIKYFLEKSNWRFAKTMPETPHWYTLRKDAVESEFLAFIEHIRAYGYDGKFGKVKYRYFDFEGYTYWTMGYVLPITILINRAVLDRPAHSASIIAQPFNAKMPWTQKDKEMLRLAVTESLNSTTTNSNGTAPEMLQSAMIHRAVEMGLSEAQAQMFFLEKSSKITPEYSG